MGQQKMLALFLLWISAVSGEYLFTLPRVMEAGSDTSFCLIVNDLRLEGFVPEQGYMVNVDLKYMSKDDTGTVEIQSANFGIVNQDGDFQKCQELRAPQEDGSYSAVVNVSVTYIPEGADSGVTVDIFGAEKDIEARKADLITLVQTDKPIYKPGQTVKFRVMTMDYMLMPKTDGYQLITIESPNGLRVMQWENVPSPNGLVSLEMKLSSDPVLGTWKIKVLYRSKETVQPFKVDEYVLPKFEVTVTPPKYLLPTTKQISGTVCAKYTYGKAVKGRLNMKVCFTPDYFYGSEERPCANVIQKIDGCYEFFIDAEDIKLGYRIYSSWGSLRIYANVTEEQTGIMLSGESFGPRLTMYPLNLKLEDDSDSYFKPGFPYLGRVVVTNPDGSPAPGEEIYVEAYVGYGSEHIWANNFTSDEDGVANFVITEFDSGVGRLSLKATAVVYESDWRYTDDELYIRTYTPSAYASLIKWYSPSNSYIYIPDVDEAVECDQELELDVMYTADVGKEYKFITVVKAGDRIVHTGAEKVKANEVILSLGGQFDETQVLKKQLRPTVRPPPDLPTFPPLPELSEPIPQTTKGVPEPIPQTTEGEVQPVEEEIIVPEIAKTLGDDETPRRKREVECVQEVLRNNQAYTDCMMGYVSFVSSLNTSGSQYLSALCSPEGRSAMQCLIDLATSCPELFESEGTPDSLTSVKTMVSAGALDAMCSQLNAANTTTIAQFKLRIPVTKDMSPSAKVLVFYMRDDKEVVATSLQFKIKSCFKNKVKMSFDKKAVKPGTNVNLNLGASPSSTCFVGMVDKSVNLLGGNCQLTPDQVFEHVRQVARPYHYLSYWMEDRAYCDRQKGPRGPSDEYFYYGGYYTPEGVDAVHAFRDVELWVETNATLETRPCKEQRPVYYAMSMVETEGSQGVGVPVALASVSRRRENMDNVVQKQQSEPDQTSTIRTFFPETWLWDIVNLGTGGGRGGLPGLPGSAGERGPMPLERQEVVLDDDSKQPAKPEPAPVQTLRTFFPETWLWDIVQLGEDGTLSFETKIPDTITEWVGNTVCTHESDGVGVTELTGVTAFKPFFVSLTLPYSAVRGEVLPVLATVFNYLSDCITLIVEFRETEGFQFSDRSGNSREFCLCGGESESTKFHIIPTIIGEIDLEVIAISTDNIGLCENVVLGDLAPGVQDGVQRQLLVEAEGVPREQTKSSYTCVTEGEFVRETVDMILPQDMVMDSERATVSVVGDIMGPTLSNLKNLLRMPYGCGEQNMASWAPNIWVLKYLANTDQLTEELEEEAEGYMRVGYQRQMKYRHNDNSYSAWGDNQYKNATGSSWLTAFVVKSMAQSSDFIVIDNDDIIRSARWLVSTQEENGCFPQVGRVFSSYLKGGLEGNNPAGLTAFTLTAFLEADLGEEFLQDISQGFSGCLDSFDVALTDTYTLSLMLYAYTIYDMQGARRAEVMAELNSRRISEDGLTHWQRNDDDDSQEDDDYLWYRAPSAEVEMTAYVLLAILTEGKDTIGDAQPIVQWLTKQRNPYGGFSSTQDTLVALQALAEFGKLTYSGNTSVAIEIKNRAMDHIFSVSPRNSLVYQSVDVNPSQGAVEIMTSGTGCALIQVNMKYNIYEEENDGPAFSVKVKVYRSRTNSNNCAMRTLEVCVSYLKGGVSNMAIAEVKMPTGWKPVVSTLNSLVEEDTVQKFEVDNNYVQLYFDEFSSNVLCVNFDVEQEIEMNPKASLVRVYDYYETGYSVTVNYTIKTTCGTKEEIPLDNAGLDCRYMQCRVDPLKSSEVCPSCPETIEKSDLEELICDASAVYKTTVRRSGTFSMKLKSDLRPKAKVGVNKFVNYKMFKKCLCPIIETGPETKAFIFTVDSDLVGSGDDIFLDEGETILPFSTAYEKIIRQLSSKQNLCEKLSRLKRSATTKDVARLLWLRRKLGVL